MQEIVDAVRKLDLQGEINWMIDLGYQLTVYARGSYPIDQEIGSMGHLIGFNELQHQVYGRIRTMRRGDSWTIDSFVQGLVEKAEHYGISRDLGIALAASRKSVVTDGRIQ
jgi:hypothetical protein